MEWNSIGNVKEVLYNYCDIADSATKTMDLQAYFDSIYGAISAIYERCKGLGTFEGAIEAIEYKRNSVSPLDIILSKIPQTGNEIGCELFNLNNSRTNE